MSVVCRFLSFIQNMFWCVATFRFTKASFSKLHCHAKIQDVAAINDWQEIAMAARAQSAAPLCPNKTVFWCFLRVFVRTCYICWIHLLSNKHTAVICCLNVGHCIYSSEAVLCHFACCCLHPSQLQHQPEWGVKWSAHQQKAHQVSHPGWRFQPSKSKDYVSQTTPTYWLSDKGKQPCFHHPGKPYKANPLPHLSALDLISVMLMLAYKPLVNQFRGLYRFVQKGHQRQWKAVSALKTGTCSSRLPPTMTSCCLTSILIYHTCEVDG